MVGGTGLIKCSKKDFKKLINQIEDWFALGEVIEINEWWADESAKNFRGKIRTKED